MKNLEKEVKLQILVGLILASIGIGTGIGIISAYSNGTPRICKDCQEEFMQLSDDDAEELIYYYGDCDNFYHVAMKKHNENK